MCLEFIRAFVRKKFNRQIPLKKQMGYNECFDVRQARYDKYVTVPLDSPNVGFDDYAKGKNFFIR